MAKNQVRAALNAAVEYLRSERATLVRSHSVPGGPLDAEAVEAVAELDDVIRQCEKALEQPALWTTDEVLIAAERVFGKLAPSQASAVITALRTAHLRPVPEPEPPRPAA